MGTYGGTCFVDPQMDSGSGASQGGQVRTLYI